MKGLKVPLHTDSEVHVYERFERKRRSEIIHIDIRIQTWLGC